MSLLAGPLPQPHPLSEWWVLPLAVLQGLSMTLSAVVIAYPAYCAAQSKVEPGRFKKILVLFANLIFTGVGVLLGIFVSGYAPVAITFPTALAANLLSNMILQTMLGIANYTKNMVVGTLVLTAAVFQLRDLGPGDISANLARAQVMDMMLSSSSLSFMAAGVAAEVLGVLALCLKRVTDNDSMLFTYALVGSSGTVLNAAIGKLIQYDISIALRICLIAAYLVNAVVTLAMAALANGTLEDPSRFVPVSSGMNLIFTCLAGVCIWCDGQRLEYPFAYFTVQLLVLLGVYDISAFDFLAAKDVGAAHPIRRSVCNSCDLGSFVVRRSLDSFDGIDGRALQAAAAGNEGDFSRSSCSP